MLTVNDWEVHFLALVLPFVFMLVVVAFQLTGKELYPGVRAY